MMVPQPNAIASHGTSRPGATSADAHSRTSRTARRAKSVRPCGHGSAGLRPAAIQGRHASARPRDLLCSTIARPPDARATSQPPILHNAAALDTVLRGHPPAFVVDRAEAQWQKRARYFSAFSRPYVIDKGSFEG